MLPIFHLRAVVVQRAKGAWPGTRFEVYVDRRTGPPVVIDYARRCARLLEMAEVIADVSQLRLEYDATARAS